MIDLLELLQKFIVDLLAVGSTGSASWNADIGANLICMQEEKILKQ